MSDYTYATLIVAAADQAAAQALLSPTYFTFALSADGTPPATHYATSGPFSNDELDTALNQDAIQFRVYFGSTPRFGGLVSVVEPLEEQP